MAESREQTARNVLALSYGIPDCSIIPIGHGLINWLARVDARDQSYVLKRYNPRYFIPEFVERSVSAQHHGAGRRVPVPPLIPNREGGLITWAPDAAYVLSRYVAGRHLPRGGYSAVAARSLGETVGCVVRALADGWRDVVEPWTLRTHDEVASSFERLLAAAEHGTTELDRRTARDVRYRLGYLHRHPDLHARVSGMPMQWIHSDLLETNVLIGDDDRVSAVVDFDNVRVLPRGFDFMWALAYCVTPLAPERDAYLRSYREVAQPDRDELSSYVPLWAYQAVGDIWPLEIRYLEPEHYDPRWEDACWGAFLPDTWEETIAEVAAWLDRA
jgi:Ser/Thr protein kinase RdoA (MazF antagonist)